MNLFNAPPPDLKKKTVGATTEETEAFSDASADAVKPKTPVKVQHASPNVQSTPDDEDRHVSDGDSEKTGSRHSDQFDKDEFDLNRLELVCYRTSFNKLVTTLQQMLDAEPRPDRLHMAQVGIERLDKLWANMTETSNLVFRSPCAGDTLKKNEVSTRTELMQVYEEITLNLQTTIGLLRESTSNITKDSVCNPSQVPALRTATPSYDFKSILARIPKFEGEPTKFFRWKDAFDLHVDSKDWDDLEKFEFLLKSTSGSAAATIAGFRVCANNYVAAKEAIIQRYGNISTVKERHVAYVLEACKSKDLHVHSRFVSFATCIVQNIESLTAVGETIAGLSLLFSMSIIKALPNGMQRRLVGKLRNITDSECKLKRILDFLIDERLITESIMANSKQEIAQANKKDSKNQDFKTSFKKFSNQKGPAGPPDTSKNEFAFAVGTSHADNSCIFCSAEHSSFKCKKKLTVEERRKLAVTQSACFKCLIRNHVANKCKQKQNCSKCGGKHATILCSNKKSSNSQNSANDSNQDSASLNALICGAVRTNAEKGLPTGYVIAQSKSKNLVCRVMLDTGSQKTLITEKFANILGAEKVGREKFYLQSAGIAAAMKHTGDIVEVNLKSRFSNNSFRIQATALPTVVKGEMPVLKFSGKLSPIADENQGNWNTGIDILLGVDVLCNIVGANMIKHDGMLAFETIFGYFICGVGPSRVLEVDNSVAAAIWERRNGWSEEHSSHDSAIPITPRSTIKRYAADDISFLWETEAIGIEPYRKDLEEAEDTELEKFYRDTVEQTPEGRYRIHLPFKANKHTLGLNRRLTENRLNGFLKGAKSDLKLLTAVDREIQDLIEKGLVEYTDPPKPGELAHYLPILAVKKAGSTSDNLKIRVVNDASARSKGEAGLNDVLFQGQNLIANLIKVVLSFRQSRIPICCDITKAYLQFEITPEHRNFLRFLWPVNISRNPKASVRELRSCRLSFGLISAPFLHCCGIRYHLEREMEKRPEHSELLKFVKDYFYVDDIYAKASNVAEAKQVVHTLIEVFKAGCFPLGKMATTSVELGEYIREKYPDTAVSCDEENARFLGVRWNQKSDTLHVDMSSAVSLFKECVPTKRSILRGVSAIFDPLSIAAPLTLAFRMQLQQLWIKKVDWDQPLDSEELETFKNNLERLRTATELSITRNFSTPSRFGTAAAAELHVFCDASLRGYGCVAYTRNIHSDGKVETIFIMAKGRVAPLKGDYSIHRLELLGAILAVRIAKEICQSTSEKFLSINYWCDNACVLAWIRDKPERWKSFVANRIIEIQRLSNPSQWRYIRSKSNSADLVSRASPLDSQELKDLWIRGPQWLSSTDGPKKHSLNPEPVDVDLTNEMKPQIFIGAPAVTAVPESIFNRPVSTWPKAVRIVAYIRRWLTYKRKRVTRSRKNTTNPVIEASEYAAAELAIIKNIQKRSFSAEIASNLENILTSSPIYEFKPFLDENGIIRCKSRLNKSTYIRYETANPIILPGEDTMVDLYLRWIHRKICLHVGGVVGVIQRVRRRFLILRVRRATKKAIRGCKGCVKFRAQPGSETMPPLPNWRVETIAPFAITAVDASGPIPVKQGKFVVGAYIMLFCCPVTRAIRLDLVSNLSTYNFLLSLRRFYSRNPTLTQLFSDNAASFRRAAEEIKFLFDSMREPDVQNFLAQHQITWKFNVARAPFRGGFYERMFATIKAPLRRIVGKSVLQYDELLTVLLEIEHCVNDRPLTVVSNDPDELLPLKPNDLICGYRTHSPLPEPGELLKKLKKIEPIVFSQRWKHQQQILNDFWNRFRKEYLQELRSAHTAKPVESRGIKVGDVVLLDNPAASRSYWPIARVQEISGGEETDGKKRTCTIRLASGKAKKMIELKRPMQLLYPLDISQF